MAQKVVAVFSISKLQEHVESDKFEHFIQIYAH